MDEAQESRDAVVGSSTRVGRGSHHGVWRGVERIILGCAVIMLAGTFTHLFLIIDCTLIAFPSPSDQSTIMFSTFEHASTYVCMYLYMLRTA
jgi:hypothetical protein